MKTCSRCGLVKALTEYHKHRASKGGLLAMCKSCVGARQKLYVQSNREKVAEGLRAYRDANRPGLLAQQKSYKKANIVKLAALKREKATGFSPALFAEVLAQQNNCCAICQVDFRTLKPQRVHADHCHLMGAPRGILCQNCNTSLGGFNDDVALLQRAVAYLQETPVEKRKLYSENNL